MTPSRDTGPEKRDYAKQIREFADAEGSEKDPIEGKLIPEISAYEPPTDEQLERFVFALLQGEAYRRGIEINAAWGARMVMQNPVLKDAWLQRHRDLAAGIARAVEIPE